MNFKVFLVSVLVFIAAVFCQFPFTFMEGDKVELHLTNNLVLIGYIKAQNPGRSLSFQTLDGSVFVLPRSEISFMETIKKHSKVSRLATKITTNYSKTNGLYLRVSFGLTSDFPQDKTTSLEAGYQISPFASVGAGLDYDWVGNLPIYLSGRLTIPVQRFSFFSYFRQGAYASATPTNFKKAHVPFYNNQTVLFFNFGFGVAWHPARNFGVFLEGGARFFQIYAPFGVGHIYDFETRIGISI